MLNKSLNIPEISAIFLIDKGIGELGFGELFHESGIGFRFLPDPIQKRLPITFGSDNGMIKAKGIFRVQRSSLQNPHLRPKEVLDVIGDRQ